MKSQILLIAFILMTLTTTKCFSQSQPWVTQDTDYIKSANIGIVGIGIADSTDLDSLPSDLRLAVKGKVRAREIMIAPDNWADFVFEPGYPLMPLAELEESIKTNRHLPDIPTEKEVAKNGIQLGEIQAKLLQKIEELTLYVIALNKEGEVLQQRLQKLESK